MLFDEFTRAFYQSDHLIILPIYPAGEKEIEGIDSKFLCEEISAHGHKDAIYMDDMESAVVYIKEKLRRNDILLTLGAGDVWKVGMALLDSLSKEE
jgi:UDP-N-acetylmuramate--alanine ligase